LLKKVITALALVATLVVPSTAMAAPKFAGLTYTTPAIFPDASSTPTTATVTGLHFERNQFGDICTVFNVTVHGSFQYWTGAEFVTMTQDPPAQRQENCFSSSLTRDLLLGVGPDPGALDCAAGTFDLSRFTTRAGSITYRGSDGSFFFAGATLEPLVLTATTAEQGEAICDLEARLPRLSDKRLVAELNDLLALFAAA
jgi:hypothetical protein